MPITEVGAPLDHLVGAVAQSKLQSHGRASAWICFARCSASSPTPWRNADLRLWSQGRPRKYRPGTLVSPRLCSGTRPDDIVPFAKIGRSIQSKSYRKPFAQMIDEISAAARSRVKIGSATSFGLHGTSVLLEAGNSSPFRATYSSARSVKAIKDSSPRTRFSPRSGAMVSLPVRPPRTRPSSTTPSAASRCRSRS